MIDYRYIKANILLILLNGIRFYYSILLFNNVDIEIYGSFTMIIVYTSFLGVISFSPVTEVVGVLYRQKKSILYVQMAINIALIYFIAYFTGTGIILKICGTLSEPFSVLFIFSIASEPVNIVLQTLLVMEKRLKWVYLTQIISTSIVIPILMIDQIELGILFLIAFIQTMVKIIIYSIIIHFDIKKMPFNIKIFKRKAILKEIWHIAKPLFIVRTYAPFYKGFDRIIYKTVLDNRQLGILNFMISVFAKVKIIVDPWIDLRLPEIYSRAKETGCRRILWEEICKVKPLLMVVLSGFLIYVLVLRHIDIGNFEEKWQYLFKYSYWLIIPLTFQLLFCTSSKILMAFKLSKRLAMLSVFSIISFLSIAFIMSRLFTFNGAFFSTMIYRESYSAIAPTILVLLFNRRANQETILKRVNEDEKK